MKYLSRDSDGFFVMFEQGCIDWANHSNDYSRMIGCIHDLDEAVKKAIEYINTPGDDIDWTNTLLIVTADHANSYMRLVEGKEPGIGDLPAQSGTSYPDGEVTYGSGDHTNEPVMIYAKGEGTGYLKAREGAWYTGTTLIDNTDIFHAIAESAGLE